MNAMYGLAWLLPLLLGGGLWACVNGVPRRGAAWSALLGGGWLLGNAVTGVLVGALHPHATAQLLPRVGALIALAGTALWVIAWRRRGAAHDHLAQHLGAAAGHWRWLIVALFALLAVRAVLLCDEILLRPTLPWDAWWVWSARAKAWALGGSVDPIVGPDAWLAQGTRLLRTGTAWNYPPLLAWIELWYAAAAGGWTETLVNLPWFGLWLALLALCYGQWRVLGAPRLHAAVGVYALGSLPLLNVHVALAGYADPWLTACFGAGVLCWLRWLKHGQRGQLALAAAFALLMPMFKFEGMVWVLCLAGLVAFGAVPARWRGRGIVALSLLFGGVVLASIALDLAWIRLARDLLSGASGGSSASSSFAVLRALADGLFAQYNWHLFWYLVFGVTLWRWHRLWHSRALRHVGALLALAVLFVLGLFLFTPAAKWAESYTAVNRLMLELVPLAATLCVLLLRDVRLGEHAASPVRTPPADTGPAAPASSSPE